MALTLQQKKLREQVQRSKLIETNSVIRSQLSSGVPIETIAQQVSPGSGLDPMDVLGAMSLAETHQMTPNAAINVLPSLMKQTYGDQFNKSDVVRSYFTESQAFKLPTATKDVTGLKEDVATEEKQILDLKKSKQAGIPHRELRSTLFSMPGGLGQANTITRGLAIARAEASWYNEDPSKKKFLEGIMKAETEEEKESLRFNRTRDMLDNEVARVQGVRDWERRQEALASDTPGVWESKKNAWSSGSADVSAAALDASSDVLRTIGTVFQSDSFLNTSGNLAKWARAYHKASQEPDLAIESVNAFDDTVNSFLRNTPYVGTSVAVAIASPDKLTPAALFFTSAAMEGSGIRQQSLDNGISEESARLRGWVGGSVNGLIEAWGGGAAKYDPRKLGKRLASFPKKITKNALTEIFKEEVPQEIVSSVFSGDVPMTDSQEIDWDEVTSRFMLLARDTAFTSAMFTSASSSVSEIAKWDKRRLANRDTVQAMNDAINFTIAQQEETVVQEPSEVAKEEVVEVDKEVDDIVVESEIETANVEELVSNTASYGVVKQKDGKYAVLDWETQQEIDVDLSKKKANRIATGLNSNELEIASSRPRDVLPTAQDIETLNHGQLLSIVFKKVSQQSQKIVKETSKAIAAIGKDLSIYQKTALRGLDISESQRNSLLNKVATATTDKERTQAVQAIEGVKEIAKKNKATARFKKLRQAVNRASKKKVSDGGIHHKAHKIIGDLLKNYTTLSPKILNSVKRTKDYLDGIRNDVASNTSEKYAEGLIPRTISNKFSELASTKISDMDSSQIEDLNNEIQRFLKLSQSYGKLATSQKVKKLKNFLNNSTANVKIKKDIKTRRKFSPKRGMVKKISDALVGIKNDDIYTIATRIWGKFDPITSIVMEGRRNQLGLTLKYTDMLRGGIEAGQISTDMLKQWSPTMHQIPVSQRVKDIFGSGTHLYNVTVAGSPQQFTMAELMSFAMHTRNSYNLGQAVKNGIATREGEMGKLTEQEFVEMSSIVEADPAAKSFIDFLESFYIEMGQDINKTSREVDGIDIATIDNYFHVEYLPEGGVVGTEYVRDALIDEDGRLKSRTSSRRPVMVRDIFEVIAEDMRAISQFAGTTEAVRQLRSLVNYAPFRNKLRSVGQEIVLEELDSRVRNFQRERQAPAGDIERAVSKIDSGMAQAVLTNPIIWALQPTSAVLYGTEASFKYTKAIATRVSTEEIALFNKNWTLFRTREEGIGASKSIASPSTIKKIFTGTGNIRDKALSGMHKGDISGVSRAGKITMAEMSDKQLEGSSLEWWKNYGVEPSTLEFNSQEYWNAFNDRADYLVTRTQPMFFDENKSSFTGSDNTYTRSLTRFRSFTDQIGRIIRRQKAMVETGDIGKAEAAKNIGIAYSLISVISVSMRALFDMMLGRKKEDGEFLTDLITSPLSLVPFVGYPAKQIASALLGQEVTAPELSAMPLIMMESIFKHSLDVAKGVRFSLDDELIKSGPNRGKWKSEQFFKDGIKGVTSDYLTLHGVPLRTVQKIEWWKDK